MNRLKNIESAQLCVLIMMINNDEFQIQASPVTTSTAATAYTEERGTWKKRRTASRGTTKAMSAHEIADMIKKRIGKTTKKRQRTTTMPPDRKTTTENLGNQVLDAAKSILGTLLG